MNLSIPAASPRVDPAVPLLLLISATTGLVDAASVLGLGKVFTANMTGNIVFLGFALVGTPDFHWPLYVVALSLFLIGAAAGERHFRAKGTHSRRQWLLWSAAVETVLLWAAAACALPGGTPTEPAVLAMIGLTATSMGFRNATVRQMKVADLTTTVLTLTMTGLAADAAIADGSNPNLGRRVAAVLSILVGALIGALLVLHGGIAAPLALAGLITIASTVMLAREEPAQTA